MYSMYAVPEMYAQNIAWKTDKERVFLSERMTIPFDVWKSGNAKAISDWQFGETGVLHSGFTVSCSWTDKMLCEKICALEKAAVCSPHQALAETLAVLKNAAAILGAADDERIREREKFPTMRMTWNVRHSSKNPQVFTCGFSFYKISQFLYECDISY